MPLPAAVAVAEDAVRAAGFDLADAKITSIEDPGAACSRVDFVPAGLISIVLRGPGG